MTFISSPFEIAFAVIAGIAAVELFREAWARAECERRCHRAEAARRTRERDSVAADEAMVELEEIQEEREQAKHAAILGRFVLVLVIAGWLVFAWWKISNGA